MDRWWPDGTERGAVLVKGIATIVASGCLLGLAQNALLRHGAPPAGLAWQYAPKTLDSLEAARTGGSAAHAGADGKPAAPAAPRASTPLPPDMNDPLGLGSASAGSFAVPDVPRPLQIQLSRVKEFFDAHEATFVDAREAAEYTQGHIPGAVNLPYDEVVTDPARLEEFDPHGKPIIVYCGGGTCELSMNLGFALVDAGKKKVLVFMGGWPEWSAAGYPVTTGADAGGA
jgi:rhodanese-related sulfurtransferase